MEVEIRYHEDGVDIGVFGPTAMVSIAEAEALIGKFADIWT